MISAVMSTQEAFVAAARKHLCAGRKSLSVPQSLDLAAQVLAVNLGLKPALLYDSNGTSPEQVQQYVSSLQSSQLVSESLFTLDLNGDTLIVNPFAVRSNLEQVLGGGGAIPVIDVCHSLEKPVITDKLRLELKSIIQDLLLILRDSQQLKMVKPLCVGKKCEDWNLCTVFGLLLDYPVIYWFDQTNSFENCLSMTPLVVTTAAVTWQAATADHRCRLYSFSVPAVLLEETQSNLDSWRLRLQEKFQQQNVFKDLGVCQSTVTLPSVCL